MEGWMEEQEKPRYEIQGIDLVPIRGWFNYTNRNHNESDSWRNNPIKTAVNSTVMWGYHFGLPTVVALAGLTALVANN